jgi:VIT1/CCC1 family predicted Fe2+/Mn2+ transporter
MNQESFRDSLATSLRSRFGQNLPDLIYGANDGLITTFAVVSGVTGASLPAQIVLILGLANLLADGVSMGASNYLAKRSRGKAEVQDRRSAAADGLVTLISFVLIGAIPLVAFILASTAWRFFATTLVTLLTLFTVGAMRTVVTRHRWWRAGLEMLMVGAAAAGIAYGIGALMSRIVGHGLVAALPQI